MGRGVVGREREFQVAADFFDELPMGPAALVLEGEAGIGKTTVWTELVDRARITLRVLSAQPGETEVPFGFAALADLVEPVFDKVVAELPEPQRHALAVALLKEQPGPGRLDPRPVAAATLSVLRALASSGPVLVAIDDLQWLDRPSLRALEFALRRLGDLPVGLMACVRLNVGGTVEPDLERRFPGGRYRRVRLGPLSLAALHHILMEELGRSFPRRTLVRIEQASGGNPLFAIEVARCLPEDISVTAALALPLPENLRRLVEDRVASLPARTRSLLVAAAAAGAPTVELVMFVSPGRRTNARSALESAAAAGVISIDGSRIRFMHPLFAAAVYALAPAGERRRVHRALAEQSTDIEERGRHLALGADGADSGLAAVLDAAAERARARGGPESAVELAVWAKTLTPPAFTFEIQRRTVRIAEYLFRAGELRQAREMLESLLKQPSIGLERARALRLLGEIHYYQDSFSEAVRLLLEALEHTGDDRQLRLTIELRLVFATTTGSDFAAGSEHAGRALALAELEGESASVAEALVCSAMSDFLVGRGPNEAKVERALRLEDPDREVPVISRPTFGAAAVALYAGRLERCDQLLRPLRARFQDRGEEGDLVIVSCYLIWSASWQGDLARAERYAVEAIANAEQIESETLRCQALAYGAVASAYSGEADLAKSRAEESLALASGTGNVAVLWAKWALALVALSRDDPRGADNALGSLTAMFEHHVPEPIQAFFVPEEIEALIALGRLEEAERVLAAFEEAAQRLDRVWALMLASRCRALLAAAGGDLDEASAQADQALRRGEEVELRIEVARTLLVAGRIERRLRRKAIAADHLRRAVVLFEEMGAAVWAERAHTEISRVGLRPPASGQLTNSERRVAALSASGLTNRQVAAQLFMSPKTVEANLARVYRKLGVHSRAELGAHLASSTSRTEQM